MAEEDQQFEEVLRAYQDKVFRLCCAMLGDRSLAEETAQEIFVRIWKGLPRYRGDASLSTWIYAIARNACLTARKKRAASREQQLDIADIRTPPASPDRTPDIMRLVRHLPDGQREAVLLFHMEEKSYDEVALMLGVPVGTVKTWLHRARRSMAESLMKENDS
ncbi:MAG TPA: RNA polymerase sigma factor [Bryobacteraceae bacterium]|nr:RNA polymerase sigma factor [Bryobacteraceae bacterium]